MAANVVGFAEGIVDQLRPYGQPLYKGHLYFQDLLSTEHNAIPHMAWEEQMAQLTGLSVSQYRFTVALFATIPFAAGIRAYRSATVRHLYSLITGIMLVYYPFGSGILNVLPIAVAAYLALLLAPRRAGVVAWCTVFPYLIYLHVVNASGESWKTGNLDFTGGAMVTVLKLIAMCVCRQDSFRKNKEDLSPYQAEHQLTYTPSPLAFFSYIFGMGDLLSGPFIEFTEYEQFIELKGPWDPKAARPMPSVLAHGSRLTLESLAYMAAYLALTFNGWNMDHYHSPWYYGQPLAVKCATFCVIGMVYQLRYFFSWKIVEAAFVFAGLDFVGYDVKTGKPQWGRCRNASFLGVWLADSARNVPLNWNICTGNFLRRYVYERIAPRNRKPGFQSLLFTQMVSALWHGLYAGYIFFFIGTAVWIYFSQVLYKTESYLPNAVRNSLPYTAIKIVWTGFVLNYMASAFQLLNLKSCLEAYSSVHFFPFIIMISVNVLGSFVKTKRAPSGGAAKGQGGRGAANGATPPPPTGPGGPAPDVASTVLGVAKAE